MSWSQIEVETSHDLHGPGHVCARCLKTQKHSSRVYKQGRKKKKVKEERAGAKPFCGTARLAFFLCAHATSDSAFSTLLQRCSWLLPYSFKNCHQLPNKSPRPRISIALDSVRLRARYKHSTIIHATIETKVQSRTSSESGAWRPITLSLDASLVSIAVLSLSPVQLE